MTKLSTICITLLFPVSLFAGTIEYEGSSTVGKFITDASKVYRYSPFNINTRTESSGGEKCALRGGCDLGGVARAVNPEVLDKGVEATLIGKDAIAVVVHESNPVDGLSTEQLRGIFTGKIVNWSEVGGTDLPITAYIVKRGSATRKVFQKVILQGAGYEGTRVVTPDAKMAAQVGREKGAIGQISFAFLQEKKGVKALRVDGQPASVSNPNYPITRPLHLVTKGAPAGDVKAFLDWALSDDGQKVVKQRFVGAR